MNIPENSMKNIHAILLLIWFSMPFKPQNYPTLKWLLLDKTLTTNLDKPWDYALVYPKTKNSLLLYLISTKVCKMIKICPDFLNLLMETSLNGPNKEFSFLMIYLQLNMTNQPLTKLVTGINLLMRLLDLLMLNKKGVFSCCGENLLKRKLNQ